MTIKCCFVQLQNMTWHELPDRRQAEAQAQRYADTLKRPVAVIAERSFPPREGAAYSLLDVKAPQKPS